MSCRFFSGGTRKSNKEMVAQRMNGAKKILWVREPKYCAADIGVGIFVVGDGHLFTIPQNTTVGVADGKIALDDHFRQWVRVIEVGAGWLAIPAGSEPVLFVALFAVGDAGERLFRLPELFHPGFGDEARRAAVSAAHQGTREDLIITALRPLT